MAIDRPLVFVDWHGVLSDSLFWHSFFEGSPKERYLRDEITKEFFTNISPEGFARSFEDWDRGKMTSEAYVKTIAEHLGEPVDWLWARFVADCKTFALNDTSYIDQIEAIKMVGKVVLATDQGEAFPRFIFPHMNLDGVFDDLLISSEIGAIKYEPEAFFAKYKDQIASGNAILVDDNRRVCDAFCSIGGYAIHVASSMPTNEALKEALAWSEQTLYGT